MPIFGLTDRPKSFLRLAKIKKGEKTENGGMRDLDYFRLIYSYGCEDVERAFKAVYGDKPTRINMRLAFRSIPEVWDAYYVAYETGGLLAKAGKSAKPNTSENGKSPANSTRPKWLDTNPEILASQQHDLLALMQGAGWFIYIVPVTATNGRTALRITISPPKKHKIGVTGILNDQVITMDDKPVTE